MSECWEGGGKINFNSLRIRYRENYQGRLTFHIPMSKGIKWSQMFGAMEKNRARLRIENYSLSQATLEEVFLSFTKYQHEHGG